MNELDFLFNKGNILLFYNFISYSSKIPRICLFVG